MSEFAVFLECNAEVYKLTQDGSECNTRGEAQEQLKVLKACGLFDGLLTALYDLNYNGASCDFFVEEIGEVGDYKHP